MAEDTGEVCEPEDADLRERGPEEVEGVGKGENPADAPRKPGLGMFRLGKPKRKGLKRKKAADEPRIQVGPRERMLILDAWIRSKLPAKDFGALVGVSKHTLYSWKKRFEDHGPAGLEDKPRGTRNPKRIPEPTRRAILLLKEMNPDWGLQRIQDSLMRGEGYSASLGAIRKVLEEDGYELETPPTKPRSKRPPRRHAAERPNELWQTDLFSFVLKRVNRRVYVVGFLDDHSRFLVGLGVYASQSGKFVLETLRRALMNFGSPDRIQSDRGTQYYSLEGKSAFERFLESRGIAHKVVPDPRKNGKIERFWGTLHRELVETAVFEDFEDAAKRLKHFANYYNFQRPHQGIGGLVPADRFFEAEPQVAETLRRNVEENALELARHGKPRKPFYLTGRIGDEAISLHAEGQQVVLTKEDGSREEVNLAAKGRRAVFEDPGSGSGGAERLPSLHPAHEEDARRWPPGTSPLDGVLEELEEEFGARGEDEEPPREERSLAEDGASDADEGGAA